MVTLMPRLRHSHAESGGPHRRKGAFQERYTERYTERSRNAHGTLTERYTERSGFAHETWAELTLLRLPAFKHL